MLAHETKHSIPLRGGELVRIYLGNFTEFDPINNALLAAIFLALGAGASACLRSFISRCPIGR